MANRPVPQDWIDLYESPKQVFAWPAQEDWIEASNSEPLSARLKLVISLADDDGIAIEGLKLIWDFASLAPQDGGAILILYRVGRWHLGRFDFGDDTHSNVRATAGGVTGLDPLVRGSHVHRFSINARLGCNAFSATKGGPPGSVAVNDNPPSFRHRMRLVSDEFNIAGLEDLPPFPLQGDFWR